MASQLWDGKPIPYKLFGINNIFLQKGIINGRIWNPPLRLFVFLLDSAQLLIYCRLKMLIASLCAFYTEDSCSVHK